MDIETLTGFFLWCSILDASLLVFWSGLVLLAPGLVYRTQRRFFSMTRETFDVVMYCFLGAFKIVFIAFNLVPYIALRIVG